MSRSREPLIWHRLPARLARGLIRIYQWFFSPLLHALAGPGAGCRFTPTCSEYASQAIHEHGLLRGGLLALRRLFKCHPWHPGGHDPVPPRHPPSPPAPAAPPPARPR